MPDPLVICEIYDLFSRILFLRYSLPLGYILMNGFCHYRSEGTSLIKYKIPTRGLLGLRNAILTVSRGTAVLNTVFDGYQPWAGDISTRDQGSLV